MILHRPTGVKNVKVKLLTSFNALILSNIVDTLF